MKGTNVNQLNDQMVDTYEPARAATLFSLFVKNDTWQVPTLTIRHARGYFQELKAANDPRLKYMPNDVIDSWGRHLDARQPTDPEVLASRKRLFQKEIELTGAMHRAGVKLLAGTDAGNPFPFPGFSLHDELGFMVQAGLTPLEALQTATIKPAEFLGLTKRLEQLKRARVPTLFCWTRILWRTSRIPNGLQLDVFWIGRRWMIAVNELARWQLWLQQQAGTP